MLLVWVDRIEDCYWCESREVKDEDEAISFMVRKGIWPEQMKLLIGDTVKTIPQHYGSAFEQKFTQAYNTTVEQSVEEHEWREYQRLKRKYEVERPCDTGS